MRNIELVFLILSLFNTSVGLNNSDKNQKQEKTQKRIMDKLDSIESKLDRLLENESKL